MNLSNDGFVAFHYRSYGTFFLQQNRLHNIHRGFTHYKYYRANKKVESGMTFPDFFDRMKLKKTLSKRGAADGTFI